MTFDCVLEGSCRSWLQWYTSLNTRAYVENLCDHPFGRRDKSNGIFIQPPHMAHTHAAVSLGAPITVPNEARKWSIRVMLGYTISLPGRRHGWRCSIEADNLNLMGTLGMRACTNATSKIYNDSPSTYSSIVSRLARLEHNLFIRTCTIPRGFMSLSSGRIDRRLSTGFCMR